VAVGLQWDVAVDLTLVGVLVWGHGNEQLTWLQMLKPSAEYISSNVTEHFVECLPHHHYKDALFAYVIVAIHLLSFTLHSCL